MLYRMCLKTQEPTIVNLHVVYFVYVCESLLAGLSGRSVVPPAPVLCAQYITMCFDFQCRQAGCCPMPRFIFLQLPPLQKEKQNYHDDNKMRKLYCRFVVVSPFAYCVSPLVGPSSLIPIPVEQKKSFFSFSSTQSVSKPACTKHQTLKECTYSDIGGI